MELSRCSILCGHTGYNYWIWKCDPCNSQRKDFLYYFLCYWNSSYGCIIQLDFSTRFVKILFFLTNFFFWKISIFSTFWVFSKKKCSQVFAYLLKLISEEINRWLEGIHIWLQYKRGKRTPKYFIPVVVSFYSTPFLRRPALLNKI